MKWSVRKADRYGNSDTEYYCNIGGTPGVDAFGAHLEIKKTKTGYDAHIQLTDMTGRPWKRSGEDGTFRTLSEAKSWCQHVIEGHK